MGGLISPAYREQNELLHAARPDYGMGGRRWTSRVVDILNAIGGKSVLDYGCGKGMLRAAIGGIEVFEYDPAIEGKTEAVPADLVVCTDVLEHIEPDLLGNVLSHLASMTRKRLFFNIATRSAGKCLPDGRNAHLLVRPGFWWRAALEKHFSIESWQERAGEVTGEAIPIREMPAIQSFPAWDEKTRFESVKRNCARVAARLRDDHAPHGRTAVLVCYGPSLKDTWHVAAKTDGDIFTVSGAHGFMLEKGIAPYAQIDCDPRPHKAAQFGQPNHAVKYWLGSCIHPDYIDRLVGHSVSLWHLHNGQEAADNIWSLEPEAWLCVGGGSVGLRSISLLYSQGYRHFEIHGMDCSLDAGGKTYAGPHLGKARDTTSIRCGDRWFESNLSLIDYARQFLDDLRLWPGATFRMHGDGLLQHMVNSRENCK
jgi:hypothetical protein